MKKNNLNSSKKSSNEQIKKKKNARKLHVNKKQEDISRSLFSTINSNKTKKINDLIISIKRMINDIKSA